MQKFFAILAIVCATIIASFGLSQPPAPPAAVPGIPIGELSTPDASIRFAMGDLASLPVDHQPYMRYLSLYNIQKEKRVDVARLVSFTVNSLSRRKKIYIPVFVGASDQTVIRLNLKDYEIDPKVWDEFGRKGSGPKPYPDPYFHAFADKVEFEVIDRVTRKEKKVPYTTTDSYGRPVTSYRTEYIDVVEKVPTGNTARSRELLSAPWLDSTTWGLLTAGTQSEFPILRADWFIVNATMDPLYSKFLGIGDEFKTFEAIVFADEKLAEKARSQVRAAVVKSSVARNNRAIIRSPTFTGGYIWFTKDGLKSIDDRNYVQNLLQDKFDASEVIATLPNGLQAYFVGDSKGKRLDKADNEIATDYIAADKVVRNARSCIYCHGPGINPIQDEVRTLTKKLQNKESAMLLVRDEKDYYKIEDLFSSDLDKQIVRDQQIYADAIGLATGLTPEQVSRSFIDVWEGYTELLLTKEQVAREMGISVPQLEQYAKLSADPLIIGLLRNPIRPVRRDQFERSYQDFMVLMLRARAGAGGPPGGPAIILDPALDHSKKKK
jgi:hypothetical protein